MRIFWACPKILNFWRRVREITQRFSEEQLPDEWSFYTLQDMEMSVRRYRKTVVCHLLNAACACIPGMWKQAQPPTIRMWLNRAEDLNRMEDLVWTSRQKRKVYLETWAEWNVFRYSEEGKALIDAD